MDFLWVKRSNHDFDCTLSHWLAILQYDPSASAAWHWPNSVGPLGTRGRHWHLASRGWFRSDNSPSPAVRRSRPQKPSYPMVLIEIAGEWIFAVHSYGISCRTIPSTTCPERCDKLSALEPKTTCTCTHTQR